MSGFSKEKLLDTGTERTTGGVIETKGEEAREEDEARIIAVEEVIGLIVLDEERSRAVGEEEV